MTIPSYFFHVMCCIPRPCSCSFDHVHICCCVCSATQQRGTGGTRAGLVQHLGTSKPALWPPPVPHWLWPQGPNAETRQTFLGYLLIVVGYVWCFRRCPNLGTNKDKPMTLYQTLYEPSEVTSVLEKYWHEGCLALASSCISILFLFGSCCSADQRGALIPWLRFAAGFRRADDCSCKSCLCTCVPTNIKNCCEISSHCWLGMTCCCLRMLKDGLKYPTMHPYPMLFDDFDFWSPRNSLWTSPAVMTPMSVIVEVRCPEDKSSVFLWHGPSSSSPGPGCELFAEAAVFVTCCYTSYKLSYKHF